MLSEVTRSEEGMLCLSTHGVDPAHKTQSVRHSMQMGLAAMNSSHVQLCVTVIAPTSYGSFVPALSRDQQIENASSSMDLTRVSSMIKTVRQQIMTS